MLTREEVLHIAKLCRLTLSDAEVASMQKELSSILDFVGMLKEVDTKNVEPTAQVTGQKTAGREDTVTNDPALADALLDTSPLPIVAHMISVPSAHG